MPSTRRLAAIVFTDLEGFTRLAHEDERGALELLAEQDRLVAPLLTHHHGRKIKAMGDGLLLEFPNARDAVAWGVEFQEAVRERNARGKSRALLVRVGIHVGDIEEADSDILGDAVNIAARIEPLAEPGGVCISRPVYDQVHNKLAIPWISLGIQPLKNVKEPFEVFKVVFPGSNAVVESWSGVARNRIAILPLANFSPDPGDSYFADGLTDEIISTVSGIGGLTVISRTSVMRYKQTSKSMTEIGRELRAGKILEGSVRKAGNRVRITVQLIDAESDAHLWAQSYDGNLDDVFETQSDIARKVAGALKLPSPPTGRPPEDPEVYALCLHARASWIKGSREGSEQAMALYSEALKIDPASARAAAGLALCYLASANYRAAALDPTGATARATELAQRAVELDERLPEAHLALGSVYMTDNWSAAEVQVRKALSLNPSHADAHEWYGEILRGQGRVEAALEECRRAYELDPLPPGRAQSLIEMYFFAGRNDDALALIERLIQADPSYSVGYFDRAIVTAMKGDREQALRDLETYRKLTTELRYLSLRARIEATLGNREEAARLIRETESQVAGNYSPDAEFARAELFCAFANTGESDRFFEAAEDLVRRRLLGPGELTGPDSQKMSKDPRFPSLVKRLRASYGLSD